VPSSSIIHILKGHKMSNEITRISKVSQGFDRLWSINEVAAYLGIPVGTLYQWRTRNYGPPGRRIGRYVRYVPEQVRDWVESLGTEVA